MRDHKNLLARSLVVTLVLGSLNAAPGRVQAQANPFGGPPATAPTDPAAAPADPAAVSNDPIATAIRESNPTSPRELAQAVQILLDAKQWSECRIYLQQLAASGAGDQVWADVHREFGTALFLRLTRTKELDPEGAALAETVLSAARRVAEDPARIDALINDLRDPALQARAIQGLREAGAPALPRLLGILADDAQSDLHPPVQRALLALHADALDPLLAALEAEDSEFLVRIAEVLAAVPDASASTAILPLVFRQDLDQAARDRVRQLVAASQTRLPSRDLLEQYLASRFRTQFRQDAAQVRIEGPATPRWFWDVTQQTVVQRPMTDAALLRWNSVRTASDLARINPEHAAARLWSFAARLEWEQALLGLEVPLPPEQATSAAVREAGPETANELLDLALDMGRSAAAVAAAQILADLGSEAQLHDTTGEAPLVQALLDPNQHVQFAAADAIMRINPSRPFAGSSRFRDTLGFFLGSATQRRALVGNPKLDEAQTWAGWMREMGIEVDVVGSGNEILASLHKNPDYEFILLVDVLDRPDVSELVQLIRKIPGYAQVRCSILTHAWNYQRLQAMATDEIGLGVFPRPHSVEGVRFVLSSTQQLPGQVPASPETRSIRGAAVLDWLAATAGGPGGEHYDLLRLEGRVLPLLVDSPLATRAARVLGAFATQRSQKQLVEVASVNSFPLEMRTAAAEAFAAAVQKRGVMLTTAEILQQYDRYNASERLDADTQRVLGAILDAIEGLSGKAAQP